MNPSRPLRHGVAGGGRAGRRVAEAAAGAWGGEAAVGGKARARAVRVWRGVSRWIWHKVMAQGRLCHARGGRVVMLERERG